MKKRQLAKPKDKITRVSRKTSGELYERYAEVLRLRDEIARLAASGLLEPRPGNRVDHNLPPLREQPHPFQESILNLSRRSD